MTLRYLAWGYLKDFDLGFFRKKEKRKKFIFRFSIKSIKKIDLLNCPVNVLKNYLR